MEEGRTRLLLAPAAQETRIAAVERSREIAPRPGHGTGSLLRSGTAALSSRGKAIGIAAALLSMGALAALALGRRSQGASCPSIVALDDGAFSYSFGHIGAQVECGASVKFGFHAAAATRVLLHYAAATAGDGSDLEIRLNGKHLAWARPAIDGEPQALPLPASLLRSDAGNVVSFLEANGDQEWSVWKVRAEVFAFARGDAKAAREAYERGRRKLEERKVAPRNLYDAWTSFGTARGYLEGLDPHPPLYAEVAQLISDTERDLDKECARLLFSAGQLERYGQNEKAQRIYREALLHFPAEDPSGCRRKAQSQIVSETALP